MAKKVVKKVKVTVAAGKATPAPPLGPALGQAKVNISEFVTKFNDATRAAIGETLPVVISVYDDKSWDMKIKSPVTSSLILKAMSKEKGSGKAPTEKIGVLPKAKLREIAEKKMKDLNANTVEEAMLIVEGTCRSMGVDVK